MNATNSKLAETEAVARENRPHAISPAGFRIINRIADWITSERM